MEKDERSRCPFRRLQIQYIQCTTMGEMTVWWGKKRRGAKLASREVRNDRVTPYTCAGWDDFHKGGGIGRLQGRRGGKAETPWHLIATTGNIGACE